MPGNDLRVLREPARAPRRAQAVGGGRLGTIPGHAGVRSLPYRRERERRRLAPVGRGRADLRLAPGDDPIERLRQVAHEVEAVGDLNGLRGPEPGALGIRAALGRAR